MSNAKASTATQIIKLATNANKTEKIVAQPGQAIQLVVDGQIYTGQKAIQGRQLRVVRRTDKLILEADGSEHALVEVSGFFSTDIQGDTDNLLGTVDPQTLFEASQGVQLASASGTPSFDNRGTLVAQAAPSSTTVTVSDAVAAAIPTATPIAAALTPLIAAGVGLVALNSSGSSAAPLTPAEVAALTASQVDALNPAQIAALGANLSLMSAAALSSIDATQAAAITATQLDSFDAADIAALARPLWAASRPPPWPAWTPCKSPRSPPINWPL